MKSIKANLIGRKRQSMCEVLGKFINNSIGSSEIFFGGAGIFREI